MSQEYSPNFMTGESFESDFTPAGPIASGFLVSGPAGKDGKSAYALAQETGFSGTESEWLASLVGPQGAPGIQGPQGIPGAKGDKGDTGAKGATGATGAKGDKGDPGATGATGAKGDKGDPGATGAKGDKGDPGATGAAGVKGDKGDPGATGAKGDKGDPGATGATGPKGDKGDPGEPGVAGAKGDKGDPGEPGAAGAKGDKGDPGVNGAAGAKGDKGDPGEPGAAGAKGDIGPQGPAGDDGFSAYQIAVNKGFSGTEEEWLDALKGQDGQPGPQGERGPQGPRGEKGESGNAGGGGDGSGRVYLSGTEESPVLLNMIIDANSYTLSGNIEGLPSETEEILLFAEDLEVNFDVDLTIKGSSEEEGELGSTIVSQTIQSFSIAEGSAVFFRRMGVMNNLEAPLTPDDIEYWESEGYCVIDEYSVIIYSPWEKVNFRALSDYKIKRMWNENGNSITIDDLFIENGESGLDFSIAFSDSALTEQDFIEDIIVSNSYLDENIYPQMRLSFLNEYLNYSDMGKAFRFFAKIQDVFLIASVTFSSEAARDEFFNLLRYWNVYLVYRSSYLIAD